MQKSLENPDDLKSTKIFVVNRIQGSQIKERPPKNPSKTFFQVQQDVNDSKLQRNL